jgi:hypothetical protein
MIVAMGGQKFATCSTLDYYSLVGDNFAADAVKARRKTVSNV